MISTPSSATPCAPILDSEEERWNEDDAEPLVVAPAATTVIEEPEEIDAEAEAEFIEASVPESTDDSDDDSDDDFAVEESDEDDDAEPMDVDAGAPALAPTAPAATLEPAAPEAALVPAAPARAPLAFDPTCGVLQRAPTGLRSRCRSHVRTIAGSSSGSRPGRPGDGAGRADGGARDLPRGRADRRRGARGAQEAARAQTAPDAQVEEASRRTAMPKFKAKAEAAEHDTDDWKVGRDRRMPAVACYFSPGGRMYKNVPDALIRMDEGPKLPTRAEQIKAAGGIKARLALCLSRATLLAPDEVVYRRPTPSTRSTPSTRLDSIRAGECHPAPARPLRGLPRGPVVPGGLRRAAPHGPRQDRGPPGADAAPRHLARAARSRQGAGKEAGLAALGFGVLKARSAKRLGRDGRRRQPALHVLDDERSAMTRQVPREERRLRVAASSATPASASIDRPRPNLIPAQAAAAYDVVARREALPVNTPTSVLEACRSVVAATLFYGTDLYHYVRSVRQVQGRSRSAASTS